MYIRRHSVVLTVAAASLVLLGAVALPPQDKPDAAPGASTWTPWPR